jgi:hypothetical protein
VAAAVVAEDPIVPGQIPYLEIPHSKIGAQRVAENQPWFRGRFVRVNTINLVEKLVLCENKIGHDLGSAPDILRKEKGHLAAAIVTDGLPRPPISEAWIRP